MVTKNLTKKEYTKKLKFVKVYKFIIIKVTILEMLFSFF